MTHVFFLVKIVIKESKIWSLLVLENSDWDAEFPQPKFLSLERQICNFIINGLLSSIWMLQQKHNVVDQQFCTQ